MIRRKRRGFELLEPRAMLSATGDFNGDGFDDVAIGVDGETIGGKAFAGAVSVLYGSNTKLKTSGNQLWSLDSPGINGVAHVTDHFGTTLASGDFDGDGFDDLAIGSPGIPVKGHEFAGVVNIIYGSSSGLTGKDDQQFTQNTPGIAGSSNAMDEFGNALAAGDFNHDGRDDLAIGVVGQKVNGLDNAGAINVLYGGSSGLKTSGNQYWTQDSSGINGVAKLGDQFGSALAAGDFNGDGRDDLAIGVRGEMISGKFLAGSVNVIYGSSSGLKRSGDQLWNQDVTGVLGVSDSAALFGTSLAAGHFNDDGFADLAIGASGADFGLATASGSVNVLYGSSGKLTTTGNQRFTIVSLGEQAGANQNFGASLAAINSRGTGRDELAVGIPNFLIGSASNAGSVAIIQSTGIGLTVANPYFRNQDTTGVADMAEVGDQFGVTLATDDFNHDGFFDLVVGVPAEDVEANSTNLFNAGVIHVLYGAATGIAGSGSQIFSQNTLGMLGIPDENDRFGGALS